MVKGNFSKQLYVIADNTWLSSAIFNPLYHNADIAVTSLTKYYSAGSCICGAILTRNNNLYDHMMVFIKRNGLHVSPLNCQLVSTQIVSLKDRIEKSSATTIKVVK